MSIRMAYGSTRVHPLLVARSPWAVRCAVVSCVEGKDVEVCVATVSCMERFVPVASVNRPLRTIVDYARTLTPKPSSHDQQPSPSTLNPKQVDRRRNTARMRREAEKWYNAEP